MSSNWYVYFVRCSDNSLYTGITTDLQRRIYEHNHSNKLSAKYTRVRRPVELVYWEQQLDRKTASQREYKLKQLKKSAKENLIEIQSKKDNI